ncbi:MAG: hypothetical protein Q9163_001243 [Psora crenata]
MESKRSFDPQRLCYNSPEVPEDYPSNQPIQRNGVSNKFHPGPQEDSPTSTLYDMGHLYSGSSSPGFYHSGINLRRSPQFPETPYYSRFPMVTPPACQHQEGASAPLNHHPSVVPPETPHLDEHHATPHSSQRRTSTAPSLRGQNANTKLEERDRVMTVRKKRAKPKPKPKPKQRLGCPSYAELIHRALKEAPGHGLYLRDIYQWFEGNTDKVSCRGWKNTIRHNLSVNQTTAMHTANNQGVQQAPTSPSIQRRVGEGLHLLDSTPDHVRTAFRGPKTGRRPSHPITTLCIPRSLDQWSRPRYLFDHRSTSAMIVTDIRCLTLRFGDGALRQFGLLRGSPREGRRKRKQSIGYHDDGTRYASIVDAFWTANN